MEETVKKHPMLVLLTLLVAVSVLATISVGPALARSPSPQEKLTFYWISHGSEGDPIWIFALDGANEAAKALGVTVNASFHHGDIALQKEAFKAAIAAGANGIAVSSPEVGVLTDEVKLAHEKGIPVVFFNTDDPATGRDAYVGADNYQVGRTWAKYLVDNNLVKAGDKVWMPVEVPGATYGADETKGIATIFDPLGIKYEVFDAKYDPVETLNNMIDYLTAHGGEINAMIGLGDMVTGFTQKAFEKVGWEPGHIPVVGWGNSADTANAVKAGFVNAGMWQFPDAQGYMPIYALYEAAQGRAINYTVYTFGLYTKDNADKFVELTAKMQTK
jgi:simple sugar transport system substrate-binding protein